MVKIPQEVKDVLLKQKPIPIATASRSGVPNVIFVGMMKLLDDETILFVDNFFNKTARNLAENPRLCVLCYDPEVKKSYQIKGSVQLVHSGPVFDEMKKWAAERNPKLPARIAIVVEVDSIFNSASGPDAGKQIA